jgi:hypothetical protein
MFTRILSWCISFVESPCSSPLLKRQLALCCFANMLPRGYVIAPDSIGQIWPIRTRNSDAENFVQPWVTLLRQQFAFFDDQTSHSLATKFSFRSSRQAKVHRRCFKGSYGSVNLFIAVVYRTPSSPWKQQPAALTIQSTHPR